VTLELKNRPYLGEGETESVFLEALSSETFGEAVALANSVFPESISIPENPETEYRISLSPDQYGTEARQLGLDAQKHWVARKRRNVVGLTGLQHQAGDAPNIAWLGWFCLHPSVRGRNLGKRLLEWTVDTAREEGYTVLRLITTDLESQAKAQVLYEKLGFRIVDPDRQYHTQPSGYKLIYRERTF
jgi:GNAT superfamily N-acetyltransferase